MEFAVAFGRVIRKLRIEQLITQSEVGVRASMQAKSVSSLEMGRHAPSIDNLIRLARALSIAPWDLLRLALEETDLPDPGPPVRDPVLKNTKNTQRT